MSFSQLKKEIELLKSSALARYEPQFKIFVFRINCLTDAGETEEDVNIYIAAHPHTHVLKFYRKSFRRL